MRVVCAAWLLAACGSVKSQVDDAPIAGDAAIDAAPDASMTNGSCGENFDDNAIDPARWRIADPTNAGVTIVEANGRFRAIVLPNVMTGNHLASVRPFAFANVELKVRVIARPTDPETATFFTVASEGGGSVSFTTYGTGGFAAQINGTGGYVTTPDNYLRIRESASMVYLESSIDGATWTRRNSGPTPTMANPQIRIGAGLDVGPGGVYELDDVQMTVVGSICPLL